MCGAAVINCGRGRRPEFGDRHDCNANSFEVIRQNVAAKTYPYTEHPRSPWHIPRVELAQLASLWLPHRQFESPKPAAHDLDQDTLAKIIAELESDYIDAPESHPP